MCLVFLDRWISQERQEHNLCSDRKIVDDEELLVAVFLQNKGYSLKYEHKYLEFNKTPDWTILSKSSKPIAILEVLSIRDNTDDFTVLQPQVNDLRSKICEIDVGVTLNITLDNQEVFLKNLTSKFNKEIKFCIEKWLKKENPHKGDVKCFSGIKVKLIGFNVINKNVNIFLVEANNLPKHFNVEKEMSKSKKKIGDKVSRYKKLAMEEDLPFIIALIPDALVITNKTQLTAMIDNLFEQYHSLSSILVFHRVRLFNWEIEAFHNPNAVKSSKEMFNLSCSY